MPIDKPRSLFHAIEVWRHDMDFKPLLIPTPTEARPGSTEKLLVLRARLEAGEDLYHYEDARIAAPVESQALMAIFAVKAAADERDANREARLVDNWHKGREALALRRKIKPAPRKRA